MAPRPAACDSRKPSAVSSAASAKSDKAPITRSSVQTPVMSAKAVVRASRRFATRNAVASVASSISRSLTKVESGHDLAQGDIRPTPQQGHEKGGLQLRHERQERAVAEDRGKQPQRRFVCLQTIGGQPQRRIRHAVDRGSPAFDAASGPVGIGGGGRIATRECMHNVAHFKALDYHAIFGADRGRPP